MHAAIPRFIASTVAGVLLCGMAAPAQCAAPIHTSAALPNPAIDMAGYLATAQEAAAWRDTHRISEQEFLTLSQEPGTIVLDARSAEKFNELHVRNAINLSFPDITVESLARILPDKNQRILIYCNNNFRNAESAFPTKAPNASLNLSTFIALYGYGYRNVYELGPQIDYASSILHFESNSKPG